METLILSFENIRAVFSYGDKYGDNNLADADLIQFVPNDFAS